MDYNKTQIRFSNFGLNLTTDESAIKFGEYVQLTNLVADFEGNLRSRMGMTKMHVSAISGNPIVLGFRRLNDSVAGTSKYLVRADDKLYASSGTVEPFTFGAELSSAHSSEFGSIIPYRPSISSDVWAYISDKTKMVKTDGVNVHPIGYTRPSGAITLVQQTVGGSLTLLGTYDYRFAFYNSATGTESRYNSPTTLTVTLTGANNRIDLSFPAQTVETGTNSIRVYRRGGTVDDFRLLVTLAYTGIVVTYNDVVPDTSLVGSILLDEDSDKPFITTNTAGVDVAGTPLPYFSDPVLGHILAVGDPNNPGYLYWTNKFDPDRHNPDNRVEVTSPQDPLMNVVVFNGTPYVFSKEAIYELVVGIGAETFTPLKAASKQGLFTPKAFTVIDQIYFMSKDGIYAFNGGGSTSITDDKLRSLFLGYTVNGYTPIDFTQAQYIRLSYHNSELWFMYVGTDGQTHFMVYHFAYRRWRAVNFRNDTASLYADEEVTSRLLFGGTNGYLLLHSGTDDEGSGDTTIPIELKTGFLSFGTPLIHKEWGSLVIDLNPMGATITISVYRDKGTVLISSTTTSASTRTKVYLDLERTFSEDIQISVTWASSTVVPILHGYELFYRADEPAMTTYHVVGVTHGIMGWQIARSAYITLRSTGAVDFNVEIYNDDGTITSTTYEIAATGESGSAAGKVKKFIPFNATKGKLFGYSLVAQEGVFRFYPDESEIHVKPWITSLGYTAVKPFSGNSEVAPPANA